MRIATILLGFTLALSATAEAFQRDRDGSFRRGRGGPNRGNERSERPNRVPIGRPAWGGNGCPAGTMQVQFAPDNLSFTILFDQFVAELDGGRGRGSRRDLMTCDAQIPIEIPANMQMEITRVDYRGFVNLPAGAQAQLYALYNFRGRGGDGDRVNLRFNFQGPLTETYTLSTDLLNTRGGTEISPCGGSTVLRVFNQMQVLSRAPGTQAQATIDSIDGQANAIYYVNWKACQAPREPDRGGPPGRDGGRDGGGRGGGRGPGGGRR